MDDLCGSIIDGRFREQKVWTVIKKDGLGSNWVSFVTLSIYLFCNYTKIFVHTINTFPFCRKHKDFHVFLLPFHTYSSD